MQQKLIQYLSTFITQERLDLFIKNLNYRTRYLTVVLEDIFQPQNASAVLRTCDCFGIQDIHIIENKNKFNINTKVELGSSKWLTMKRYNTLEHNSLKAINELKTNGYRIVATSSHLTGTKLENFDLSKGKAAFVFGSELPGISEIISNEADEFLTIPMYGFTESFNLSVSAAIILHHLTLTLRESNLINWKLTTGEKDKIKLEWLRRSIKKCEMIESEFYKSYSDSNN
jgi:tRNA (guanosine-2'-O-)-methyltransferase